MNKKVCLLSSLLLLTACGSNVVSSSVNSSSSSSVVSSSSTLSSSTITSSQSSSSFELIQSTTSSSSKTTSSSEVSSSKEERTNWKSEEIKAMQEHIGFVVPFYNYSVNYLLFTETNDLGPFICIMGENEKTSAVNEYWDILLDAGYTYASTTQEGGFPTHYFVAPLDSTYSAVVQIEYFPGTSEYYPSFDIYAWKDITSELPSGGDDEGVGGVDLDGDDIIDMYDPIYNYVDSTSFPAATISEFYQTYNCDTAIPYFESTSYSTAVGVYDIDSYLLINAEDPENKIFDKFKHDCIALGWSIIEEQSTSTFTLMKGNTGEKQDLNAMFQYDAESGIFTLNVFAKKVYYSDRSFAYSNACPTATIESFIKTFYGKEMTFPSFKGDMFHVLYNKDYYAGIGQLRIQSIEADLSAPTQAELVEALENDGWEINMDFYNQFGYFASKDGVEVEFFSSSNGSFTLALFSEPLTPYL